MVRSLYSANDLLDVSTAVRILQTGGLIAYPTEGVYGVGCDPLNEAAVHRLLALKKRPISKGLILIAANWEQLKMYLQVLPENLLAHVQTPQDKPITWVFPAASFAPPWICGEHTTIAVRVTTHPTAKQLCEEFNSPLVSTSANLTGHPPAKTVATVEHFFSHAIAGIVSGKIGNLSKPTEIRDAVKGKIIRQ